MPVVSVRIGYPMVSVHVTSGSREAVGWRKHQIHRDMAQADRETMRI